MSLTDERREYLYGKLDRDSLQSSPLDQFEHWLAQARETTMADPTAMVLATADIEGRPSQRTVLLKGLGEKGLVFYTNFGSRKARQMQGNQQVSVLFPWLDMDRQVIVAGTVDKLPDAESKAYFQSRPRGSQLAAWTSVQSQPVESRQLLDEAFDATEHRFTDQAIPRPDFWGGYRITPNRWEFWQGGARRLHDRFVYEIAEDGWRITRLSP